VANVTDSSEMMRSTIARLLETCMSKQPLPTNCVLYGSLSGLAELSQQTVLYKLSTQSGDKKDKYDLRSVGNYVAVGGGVFAPVLHFWYKWLDRVMPGTAARIVARKVAVDAVVFAVPYYTAFYVCLNYLSKVPLEESLAELRKKLVPTILSTTAFWVPAQTINFRYISPKYRVIYLAGCTFVEFNILAIFKRLKL